MLQKWAVSTLPRLLQVPPYHFPEQRRAHRRPRARPPFGRLGPAGVEGGGMFRGQIALHAHFPPISTRVIRPSCGTGPLHSYSSFEHGCYCEMNRAITFITLPAVPSHLLNSGFLPQPLAPWLYGRSGRAYQNPPTSQHHLRRKTAISPVDASPCTPCPHLTRIQQPVTFRPPNTSPPTAAQRPLSPSSLT